MIHHIQSLFWVAVVQLSLYDSCAQAGVLDYFSSKARSIYQQPSPNDPNDYGVDVSFPIHSFKNFDPNSFQGKRYSHSMETCAAKYSESECMSSERARVNMNFDQPRNQHNYTKLGFKKQRLPEEVFSIISTFYENNKDKPHAENWPAGNTYCNHWDSPTMMISTEDGQLRGSGIKLKNSIWNGIKPLLEEWTGHKLKPTSLYGIRLYHHGAILATHVDRLPLVTSCIINVAQDINEPWPVEVYDHDGKAHNVTMAPGDVVFYESHTVLHGRPTPLNGSFYANIFVHFEPVDHAEMNGLDRKDHLELWQHDQAAATASRRKVGGHEADNHDEAELLFHREAVEREQKQRERGEEVDEQHLPLNDAAARGDLAMVQDLLRQKPSLLNQQDQNGWQAIHEAVRGGHLEVLKFLVENGSDLSTETVNGGSPMWWARRSLGAGHSVIQYLEDIGAPDRLDE